MACHAGYVLDEVSKEIKLIAKYHIILRGGGGEKLNYKSVAKEI